ncbi:MAG: alanyl-tRNA editing protein [Mesosutterella sp.]|uniref:Alanyl-tRNA editing protein n=1 Tax=Mesosutterella faecium TaxID=2925194 RepID=A0ABT7IQK6_9BURK|nr:alanyl-tRNA editing protein [Mesosutterella sp. AGMB02718]MCI6530498.1 alanyl-tRNA editing protein [Mesosutterella sp.]MDL2060183.1 alanyl-tRNA editing protein [Mesosutterella sp. AGMB02718]
MPTERLYYAPGCLEADCRVISCSPLEGGLFAIVLDRTPFHPKGGGQPADRGTLAGVPVEAVYEDGSGCIVHAAAGPLAEGSCVRARVDEAARTLHSRLHSAAHLFSAWLESRGWQAVKGDHFPGQSRVVFKPRDAGSPPPLPEAHEIEEFLEKTAEEKLPFRQSVDARGWRTVTWGSLPAYPCGGTHVADTSGIGTIRVTKIRFRKGELSVSYEAA